MQKKSEMAQMGNAVAFCDAATAQASKTAQLLSNTNWRCEVCEGRGHEYWECPTKKRLDAFATKNGESALWGSWKYHKYYHAISADDRKLHKELASAAAGRKRLHKQAGFGNDYSH